MFKGFKALLVAAAATLLLGSGCGESSSGEKVLVDATPAAMRQAGETTLAKGTSNIEFTMTMAIQGHDVTMSGTGATDPANKRFRMSFDAKELFRGLLQGKSAPPEVAASFDEPLDVILDGAVMYMHFPALAAAAGGDKEWIKIDLAAANEDLAGLLGDGGGGAFGSDPSSFLQFLAGAGKVNKVGEEDVRGVKTTHFSGSYTFKDALAALPDDQRDKVERAFKSLSLPDDAQAQEIPFDAWIDADGLVRRVRTEFDYSKLAPGGAAGVLGSMSQTIEFFDFGTQVDIQLPADDEVQDLSALAANASKFSSANSSVGN